MLSTPKIAGGPFVMGVLNITPDSFSDGGRWLDHAAAVDRGLAMLNEGADLIDIGGESTRPGASPASDAEEIARVLPLIEALRARTGAPISIDTMKPEVARAAFAAGASIWNDIAALRYSDIALSVAAELNAPVILMHKQDKAEYGDVVADVIAFLNARAAAAEKAGVAPDKIWVDPGIGGGMFGKTPAQCLTLIGAIARIRKETACKLLFGASRKSFIGAIDGSPADKRLGGSVAAALLAAQSGADMVRVHDVHETVQALRVWRAVNE